MSVPNQTPYNIYTANGVTTVFPFGFLIFDAGDLVVSLNGTALTSGFTVSGVSAVNGGSVTFLTPPVSGAVVMLARNMPLVRQTEYQDNGDLLAATINKDFDRVWMVLQGQAVNNSLNLARPGITYDYYAGKGYRVSGIADPVSEQDAATKIYTDLLVSSTLAKTLRVPETSVSAIPAIDARRNKILAFDELGGPIAVVPESGSAADVLIQLAKPTGAGIVGTESGTVQQDLDARLVITNLAAARTQLDVYSKAEVKALIDTIFPIGVPIDYPLAAIPATALGITFFKMNGGSFNTATYPKLAACYPSGVLPDLRGGVARGWDDGRGVDTGRTLLSEQTDALQNITGTMPNAQILNGGVGNTGAFNDAPTGRAPYAAYSSVNAGQGGVIFNAANVVRTATETRMRNIAFNKIVRAS